jgi:hypothetical protein
MRNEQWTEEDQDRIKWKALALVVLNVAILLFYYHSARSVKLVILRVIKTKCRSVFFQLHIDYDYQYFHQTGQL